MEILKKLYDYMMSDPVMLLDPQARLMFLYMLMDCNEQGSTSHAAAMALMAGIEPEEKIPHLGQLVDAGCISQCMDPSCFHIEIWDYLNGNLKGGEDLRPNDSTG